MQLMGMDEEPGWGGPGEMSSEDLAHCSQGKVSLEEKHVKSDHMGALLKNVQQYPGLT